jgi:hypothetical protein
VAALANQVRLLESRKQELQHGIKVTRSKQYAFSLVATGAKRTVVWADLLKSNAL